MDAVRADHLSCYGYNRETTPIIDSLAESGIRFERCYSPATWTRPVAASILSGLYPPAHGTRTRGDAFEPPTPSLASQFSTAGHDTVGITTMGNVSSSTGFDDGFDTFYDLYKDPDIVERRRRSSAEAEELRAEDGAVALPRAEDINRTFRDWYESKDGGPFFAFCWSIEPHVPYDPPEDYRTFSDSAYEGPATGERDCLPEVRTEQDVEQLEALYDDELRYNDACIGELVGFLREAEAFDDTLLIIVGDHGEGFGEHGRLTHGHAPYEELVHVPLVVNPPADGSQGHQEVGGTDSELVSLVDLYPTLVEYALDEDPTVVDNSVVGTSLAGALDGNGCERAGQVYFETQPYDMDRAFRGTRTGRYKYMEMDEPDMDVQSMLRVARSLFSKGILLDVLRDPRYYWNRYRYDDDELLFDLESDPNEQENLVGRRPEVRGKLASSLATWLGRCERYFAESDPVDEAVEIDEKTTQQLKKLGYRK